MKPATKTIIFTGFPTADTEMLALDIHVDYYLSKDVRTDIFLKYIDNVLTTETKAQLSSVTTPDKLVSDREGIEIDLIEHIVYKYGVETALTTKEFQFLSYFLAHKREAISREMLINAMWDHNHELVNYRVIDTHIKALRRKLNIISIQSIRGLGYKWNE